MGNNKDKGEKKNHAGGKNDQPSGQEPHKEQESAAPEAPAIVAVTQAELDALKAKAAERDAFYDKYMRAHAEFENARKRLEKEKNDFIKYANDGLIMEFLPMFDNLELAERYIQEAKDFKVVKEGVAMIQMQIQKVLKDIGVERIKTVGAKFDPHFHDALEIEETDDKGKEDGAILAELKPGYLFNGRLLRPASVKICKRKT